MSEDINRFILDKLEKVDDKLEEVRVKYSRLEESFKNHEGVDEKIHDSINELATDLNSQMSKVLTSLDKYNLLLQDHMRRTEIGEERLEILQAQVMPMFEIYKKREIISVYRNTTWKTYMKWAAGVTTIAGAIITLAKVFELF